MNDIFHLLNNDKYDFILVVHDVQDWAKSSSWNKINSNDNIVISVGW